jgi:hypothetical protein
MKNIARFFLPIALALASPSLALATIHQVTHLSAAGSSVIIQPGSDTKVIIIQNNGSNDIRLSIDGGSGWIVNGQAGTNPTPTTGYLLKGGQTPADRLIVSTAPYTGITPDPTLHKPIVAIMVSSTTTLDIETDGTADSYPTN